MAKVQNTDKYGPDDVGCYLDGARGWRISGDAVLFAESHGFNVPAGIVNDDEPDSLHEYEFVSELADEAVDWLNEHLCEDSVSFGFHDGDFILATADEWESI